MKMLKAFSGNRLLNPWGKVSRKLGTWKTSLFYIKYNKKAEIIKEKCFLKNCYKFHLILGYLSDRM